MFYLLTNETFWIAAGSIGTVGTLIFIFLQIKLTRIATSSDLILRLEDRFESKEFKDKRSKAVKVIKEKNIEKIDDIREVFDFFETIGILVRRNVLDKELVWSTFFYWVYNYYFLGKEFLDSDRENFPRRYDEFVWLYKELYIIDKLKGGKTELEGSNFLDEEI